MAEKSYKNLQEKLGCQFKSLEGMRLALTHSSAGTATNYERLEFLGDRVLGLVMAYILYETFPAESEGDLAKRHAALVQGTMLANIARRIDLGQYMELSSAERSMGGTNNENILADGLEALIGALYIDSGLAACEALIRHLWGDSVHIMITPPQDAKTALQEWAQGRGLPLPVYEVAAREGPDHAPIFDMCVTVEGYAPVTARGASRRVAEKEAARMLLEKLQDLS